MGDVFVFRGEKFPDPIYAKLAKYTTEVIQSHGISTDNLINLLSNFFAQKFDKNAISKQIQILRNNLQFKSVAKKFKMIDNQESVVCRWGEGATLIDSLINKPELSSQDWKQLQRYTATLPRGEEYKKFIINCDNGMKIWGGDYDENIGLCLPG